MPSARRPASGICPGACPSLPHPRFFHRRRHLGICQQGIGHQILRGQSEKNPLLLYSFCVRDDSGRMFLHCPPSFRWHLHERRGNRPCDGFPVLGAGHQCSGHHFNRQSPGLQTGAGPGPRRHHLRCHHRPYYAYVVQQRRRQKQRKIRPSCLADPEKIRFIAYFDKNVSEIFPYLNAILDGAIYNHEGKTLTIKKEGRLISLHPNKIAAGKVIDEDDAHHIIDWIKEKINFCHDNKDSIEPSIERRQKLSALDIYKLLPGTNCRKCEEPTCIAFAAKLSSEEISVLKCTGLFSGDFTDKRKELLGLLKASGYKVPGVFVCQDLETHNKKQEA